MPRDSSDRRTLQRLPATLIAERREHVRRLDLMGSSIPTIVATITAQAPHLLEGQAEGAVKDIIRNALAVTRQAAAAELSELGVASPGARAIVDYIESKRIILNEALALAG